MKKETLHLTLKKKWFDMIASGEKKEEYREIKPYWGKRFCASWCKAVKSKCEPPFKSFDTVTFRNGYDKDAPTMVVECKGISIGHARPEWSDNWQGEVFVIKLGEIIKH